MEVSPEDNTLGRHTDARTFLKDGEGGGAGRQLTLFAPPLCHKHKGFFSFHENGMKALTEETVVQILEERAI